MEDAIKILEKIYWEQLAEEGITKEDADIIMLDIEFSPVTPCKGCDPCEVIETKGGEYIVKSPLGYQAVTPDILKVMRFRYLQFDPQRVARREQVSNFFSQLNSNL